jgi:peptide/nickel transport system permease protein
VLMFIVRRAGLGLGTLLVVSVLVFAATQVLPGNAATAILGKSATPDRVAALENQLRLHESVVSQYGHWLGGIVRGDPGTSVAAQRPVTDILGSRVANSAFLVLLAGVIMLAVSLSLGVWAAVRRDTAVDHVLGTLTLVLAALPEFVIAIALVLVFATSAFHLFPAVSLMPPDTGIWTSPKSVVLPVATLVLAVTPYVSRIMRGSMIEVLESEYVQMARLKGIGERKVIWRHAVPNALVPAIQVSAAQLAWMAGGMVLVEYVFSYPGVGAALVDSVSNRDVVVVQAITLLLAGIYVALNLLADVITVLLTPRLRTAMR